jgi:hypothetical protein
LLGGSVQDSRRLIVLTNDFANGEASPISSRRRSSRMNDFLTELPGRSFLGGSQLRARPGNRKNGPRARMCPPQRSCTLFPVGSDGPRENRGPTSSRGATGRNAQHKERKGSERRHCLPTFRFYRPADIAWKVKALLDPKRRALRSKRRELTRVREELKAATGTSMHENIGASSLFIQRERRSPVAR